MTSRQKRLGQYMTPPAIADRMVPLLELSDGMSVCDPACGTGELLMATLRANGSVRVTGIDVDDEMVMASIANVSSMTSDADISQGDAFDASSRLDFGRFDRVIANPPYLEVKRNDPRLAGDNGFTGFAMLDGSGRLNLYGLFVERCVRMLRDDGVAVLLVPPSMNNGRYFEALRRRILELSYVSHIEVIRDSSTFDGATQSVQIIVLHRSMASFHENAVMSQDWLWEFDDGTLILTDDVESIREASERRIPITDIGLSASTGAIVWNQHKDEFVGDGEPHDGMLRCVFSRDITDDHRLVMSDRIQARGHWIPSDKAVRSDAIVVNRIVGGLDAPRLRFAKVTGPFCAENHVNVITGGEHEVGMAFDAMCGLSEDGLSRYLKATTGNTQVSARELERLPIIPRGEGKMDVSDGETMFVQGFVEYVRGGDAPSYDVPDARRPKALRGRKNADVRRSYDALMDAIGITRGADIGYSRDNRNGSDFEVGGVSYELKLGKATDINAGFSTIYDNLLDGRGPLGDFVGKEAMEVRRSLFMASGERAVRERMSTDVHDIARWYAGEFDGARPSESGQSLLNAYAVGITNAREALSDSHRQNIRAYLRPNMTWDVVDARRNTGAWTLHDFQATDAGRFAFYAGDGTDTLKILLNWKNRWRTPDGRKAPSSFGCSVASFNCWWQ